MRTFLLTAVVVTGCAPGEMPAGEPELVRLQYLSGNGFSVGGDVHPALDRAMMAGTRELIGPAAVGQWLRLPALAAASTDETVFEVTNQTVQCMCAGQVIQGCLATTTCETADLYRHYEFEVAAHAPGDADFVLHDVTGAVFDATTLSVRAPAELVVERLLRSNPNQPSSVTATAVSTLPLELFGSAGNNGGTGAEAPVWVRPRDASGAWLVASTGIGSVISNGTVAEVVHRTDDGMPSSYAVQPRALGQTKLRASVGSIQVDVDISVH